MVAMRIRLSVATPKFRLSKTRMDVLAWLSEHKTIEIQELRAFAFGSEVSKAQSVQRSCPPLYFVAVGLDNSLCRPRKCIICRVGMFELK